MGSGSRGHARQEELTSCCRLQGRREEVQELDKELRQCKLQHFILQSGGPPPDRSLSKAALEEFCTSSHGLGKETLRESALLSGVQ